MHATYLHGDFGDGRMVETPRKRAEVRSVVGADAEALVAAYTEWPWWERLTALRDEGAGALAEWERPLALLRLANELEERLDLGTEYSPHGAYVYPVDDLIVCAEHFGRPALVELAREITADNDRRSVPPSLRRSVDASQVVPPRSMRTRLWIRCTAARDALRRVASRMTRQ